MTSINIEALKAERASLVAANEASTSWGAAVGARHERIKGIDRTLALSGTPSVSTPPERDDERLRVINDHSLVGRVVARGDGYITIEVPGVEHVTRAPDAFEVAASADPVRAALELIRDFAKSSILVPNDALACVHAVAARALSVSTPTGEGEDKGTVTLPPEDELADIIRETVHDQNDVDGVSWSCVARDVARALRAHVPTAPLPSFESSGEEA